VAEVTTDAPEVVLKKLAGDQEYWLAPLTVSKAVLPEQIFALLVPKSVGTGLMCTVTGVRTLSHVPLFWLTQYTVVPKMLVGGLKGEAKPTPVPTTLVVNQLTLLPTLCCKAEEGAF